MAQESTFVHLAAGGTGGTAGAVLTCPLEVIKTRLQSSIASKQYKKPSSTGSSNFDRSGGIINKGPHTRYIRGGLTDNVITLAKTSPNQLKVAHLCTQGSAASQHVMPTTLWRCFRYIVHNEGYRGLFKGLGPNLVGVAPSRSAYFWAYSSSKRFWNSIFTPDTPYVHILSASSAGFFASTLTNPIWFVKTRVQLDQKASGSITVSQCVKKVYKENGIRGFYRGISASYYGISETVIHFVIYEQIKAKLHELKVDDPNVDETQKSYGDFLKFMVASACSKSIATCCAYPHGAPADLMGAVDYLRQEVVRTRLREEGSRYTSFWGTVRTVFCEEGLRGLYRGLSTQLVRQIPNTAVMMATYELVVYLCTPSEPAPECADLVDL